MLRQNTDQLKASLEKVRLNQKLATDLLAAKTKFNEIAKSGRYGQEAVKAVTAEVAALSAKAREAGLNVGKLRGELRGMKLQQAGINLQVRGQAWREKGQSMRADAKSKIVETATSAYALFKPLNVAAAYEDVVKDIAITGDMTRKEEADLAKSIRGLAVKYNQQQAAVADSMKKLVETGMDKAKAEATTPLLAKTATATRADTGDAAKMARSFELLEVRDMELAFNQAAKAGKSGSFELANMAKWFPELGGYMKELGVKGNEAVVSMAARMQIATRTAGGNDEAANNFKNFLSKLTSQDTIKDFKKKAGIDLIPTLQAAARQGMDPIAAGVELVMKHVASKAPEAAKELKKVAAEVAAIKDPVERQAELERRQGMIKKLGDRAGLGELFQDMQAVSYLLAEMQNQEELKRLQADVKTGKNADGHAVIDTDFERRTEGMSEKLKSLKIAGTELGIAYGNALIPVVEMLVPWLKKGAEGLTAFTEKYPALSRLAVVAMTGASAMTILGVVGKFVFGGLLSWAGGIATVAGWLLRLRIAGQVASGLRSFGGAALQLGRVLGGTLVRGLMLAGRAVFILGRALLLNPIGLAVTGIAVAAFLIYRNWDKIGPWFKRTWATVKAGFEAAWSWFTGLPGKFMQLGADIINGLVNGVSSKLQAAKETIVNVGSSIKAWFANTLGIKSPSRVFMGLGANIGEGAAIGVRRSVPALLAAMGALSAATLAFAPAPVSATPTFQPLMPRVAAVGTPPFVPDSTVAVRGQWTLPPIPQVPQQTLSLLPLLAKLPVIGPMLQPLVPRMASIGTPPYVPDSTAAVRGEWTLPPIPQVPQQTLRLLPLLSKLPVIGPMLQPLTPRMASSGTPPYVPDSTAAVRGQWSLRQIPQVPQQTLSLLPLLAKLPVIGPMLQPLVPRMASIATPPYVPQGVPTAANWPASVPMPGTNQQQTPSLLEEVLRTVRTVRPVPAVTAPGTGSAGGGITVHYAPHITVQDQGSAPATGAAVQTALVNNQRELERMLQRLMDERARRSIS